MAALALGQPLPDVTFLDDADRPVTLASLAQGRALVVFFYPKDNTPICTVESCAFRDQHADFRAAGAEVVGISADDRESHRRFKAQHQLPYPLLSDPGARGAAAFGVKPALMGLLPGRETFVFDAAGRLIHHTVARFSAQRHVDDALAALRRTV